MKKLLKYSVVLLASLSLFSCKNTLTVSSPSVVDGDFVFGSYETAKTVLLGAYNTYLQCNTNSEGLFCNWDNMGSDVERCSIGASAAIFIAGAQLYLNSTEDYQITNAASSGIWDRMYSVIAKCNQVIYYIEGFDNFEQIKSSAPNDWSDRPMPCVPRCITTWSATSVTPSTSTPSAWRPRNSAPATSLSRTRSKT